MRLYGVARDLWPTSVTWTSGLANNHRPTEPPAAVSSAGSRARQYGRGVRIAAVQLHTTLDKAENRVRATGAIEEGARRGAAVVVLPEATMSGFGAPEIELGPLAEGLDGPFASALEKACASSGVTALAGMFERVPGEGRVYNTVLAMGPSGLIGSYRKLHMYDALGWQESARVKPADPVSDGTFVFESEDFVLGVMTCYDLRFPEMARALVQQGATVLVVPANWVAGPGKAETWTALLRARAIESTAYVVAAAKPAPECAGQAMILDPLGQVMASLGATGEELVTADLSTAVLGDVRTRLPVLEHRRFEVRPRIGR